MRGNNSAQTVNKFNKGRDLKYTSRHCIALTAGSPISSYYLQYELKKQSFVTCKPEKEYRHSAFLGPPFGNVPAPQVGDLGADIWAFTSSQLMSIVHAVFPLFH